MKGSLTYETFRQEVVDQANLGPQLGRWRKGRNPKIVEFVQGFEHKALLRTIPADVGYVMDRSSHALGTLDKTQDTHRFIAKANPPWAILYLFHDCTENRFGRIPAWGEFFEYVTGPASSYWWWPVMETAKKHGVIQQHARAAATWRLATAWQSALRTVYTMGSLRWEHHVPIRYHLLAHVEFKIDGWHRNRLIRVVMPNEYERGKTEPRTIFAETGFQTHDVVVERQGYGQVWLPGPAAIRAAARFLTSMEPDPKPLTNDRQQSTMDV